MVGRRTFAVVRRRFVYVRGRRLTVGQWCVRRADRSLVVRGTEASLTLTLHDGTGSDLQVSVATAASPTISLHVVQVDIMVVGWLMLYNI